MSKTTTKPPAAAPSWATRAAAPPVVPPEDDELAALQRDAAASTPVSPDVAVHAPPQENLAPPPGMAQVEPPIEVEPTDGLVDAPRDGQMIFLLGAVVQDKPERIPAKWRRHRFYKDGQWHRAGKWIHAVSGVEVGFMPTGWEPWLEMPAAPFKVPEPTLSPEQERRFKAMGKVR